MPRDPGMAKGIDAKNMRQTGTAEEVFRRHRAFWTREPTEAPILGDKRIGAFALDGYSVVDSGRPLTPDDIDVDSALEAVEAQYRDGYGFLDGGLVWAAVPMPGVPWMEAILGCPVYVSQSSGSLWPSAWLEDWDAVGRAFPLAGNPWYRKLLELTEAIVSQAGGRYPVCPTVMMGPADLVVALRGHERTCLDLYDHPAEIRKLADVCTDVWLEVARAQFNIIPPFAGGYAAPRLEVWAPGELVRLQEDASILFSNRIYEDFFFASDERIVSNFDFSIMHTHSGDLKLVDSLLSMDGLSAVQVLIDPSGPELTRILPELARVQDSGKALLVTHELPEREVDLLVNSLSPKGLAIERMRSV
jgi:hypothetical protein